MPGFSSPPNPKEYQATVWEIARQVPPGKVTTYGQIAAMIPPPGTLNLRLYETLVRLVYRTAWKVAGGGYSGE